jgi:hypothetical protein
MVSGHTLGDEGRTVDRLARRMVIDLGERLVGSL